MAKKLIEHRPTKKTNVDIDGVIYKCNADGVLWLPKRFKQFNPVKEEKTTTEEVE